MFAPPAFSFTVNSVVLHAALRKARRCSECFVESRRCRVTCDGDHSQEAIANGISASAIAGFAEVLAIRAGW